MFRRFIRRGDVILAALHPSAVWPILRRRATQVGLTISGLERMSLHGLRAGFFAEAYRQGARNQKSWTTFVVATCKLCRAMSAAPSASARARCGNSGCETRRGKLPGERRGPAQGAAVVYADAH